MLLLQCINLHTVAAVTHLGCFLIRLVSTPSMILCISAWIMAMRARRSRSNCVTPAADAMGGAAAADMLQAAGRSAAAGGFR
jgi:hypothetical protein